MPTTVKAERLVKMGDRLAVTDKVEAKLNAHRPFDIQDYIPLGLHNDTLFRETRPTPSGKTVSINVTIV